MLSAVFLGVDPLRAAAGLAVDDPVHRGRARLRGAPRPRQRRRVQAGPAVLPDGDGHGHRPGGRDGRPRRLLPAAAARRSSATASARSGPASCCWRSRPLALWRLNARVFLPRQEAAELALPPELRARGRAAARGRLGDAWSTALLVAAIVVGSRNLQNFDAALVIYTFAVVFATWGVAYHYCGLAAEAAHARVLAARLAARSRARRARGRGRGWSRSRGTHLLGQTFIRQRSPLRWWMHQLPLLGLPAGGGDHVPARLRLDPLRQPAADDPMTYVTYVFGFPTAVLPGAHRRSPGCSSTASTSRPCSCSAGIALSLWRRMRDQGALAVQSFGMDFFPLILLFAISVTGPGPHRLARCGCAGSSTGSCRSSTRSP